MDDLITEFPKSSQDIIPPTNFTAQKIFLECQKIKLEEGYSLGQGALFENGHDYVINYKRINRVK